MNARDFASRPHTEVLNQVHALEDYDLAEFDRPLLEAIEREGAAWAMDDVRSYGRELGTAHVLQLGDVANRFEPELLSHDRFGNRVDRVEFHPAYHELMTMAVARGAHASVWTEPRPGAHVARAALGHLRHQVEQGTSCPLTMTFAVVPSLALQPDVMEMWWPLVTSTSYDPRLIPAAQKQGALFGMAMTERQGGSDVRANSTRAVPIDAAGPGAEYRLDGHKWFCSAPMCDAFLVLAQAPGGLSCFLVPRFRPDGTRNGTYFNRLKRKLGNRSNASGELELRDCHARMVGDEGRGVATIIEMVRHTRLDCALGGAALIRRCVAEATHHAAHRFAFGRRLADHPLMQNVLADLCLESEAATALAFRLARAFDDERADPANAAFARIATPIAKYWITKQETVVAREAMECLGGNGYVEESALPRLFRESPLNSIWEGAGNVQCIDLLRAMQREPRVVDALFAELAIAAGSDRSYDAALDAAKVSLGEIDTLEVRARRVVESLALLLQANALLRFAPPAVADAFCATRLGGDWGRALGTLPHRLDFAAIIDRSTPRVG